MAMWRSFRSAIVRAWRKLAALGEAPPQDDPPPFMSAAALREAALLSQSVDAIARKKVA